MAIASVPRGYITGLLERGIGDPVLVRRVLVGKAVSGTAGAGARRITALKHTQRGRRGEPVARRAVEEALLHEAGEVVHRARRLCVVEFHADRPPVGDDARGDRRRRGGRSSPILGGSTGLLAGSVVAGILAVGPERGRRLERRQGVAGQRGRRGAGLAGLAGMAVASVGIADDHGGEDDDSDDRDHRQRGHHVADHQTGDGQASPVLSRALDLRQRHVAEDDAQRCEEERGDQRRDRHGVRGTRRRIAGIPGYAG